MAKSTSMRVVNGKVFHLTYIWEDQGTEIFGTCDRFIGFIPNGPNSEKEISDIIKKDAEKEEDIEQYAE